MLLLVAPAAAQRADPARTDRVFPMVVTARDAAAGELLVQPDLEAVRALAGAGERIRLVGVPLPDGRAVDLELERLRPERLGFGYRVDGVPRDDLLAGRALSVWKGTVAGEGGSSAKLSFSDVLCGGWLETGGERVHLVARPDPAGNWRAAGGALVTASSLARRGAALDFHCEAFPSGSGGGVSPDAPPTTGPTATGCLFECSVAMDTDWQFFEVFGDLDVLSVYVTTLLTHVSSLYEEQAATVLTFPHLAFYTTEDDPWTTPDVGGDAQDMLFELRAAWLGQIPAGARLGHILSGANLGGGRAYIDVLCGGANRFAVSGNATGAVSFPVEQSVFNWDFYVVAHELGHNFSSPHTHDFCPPIDECAPHGYWGACQDEAVCQEGTIMSYCHLCPGGMENIAVGFHPTVSNRLFQRAATCLPELPVFTALVPGQVFPDSEVTVEGVLRGAPQDGVLAHTSADGVEWEAHEMEDLGGDRWRVSLPGQACGSVFQLYLSTEMANCGPVTYPPEGAAEPLRLSPAVPVVEIDDDFEDAHGWTARDNGATSGLWTRAVPAAGGHQPYHLEADYDGSGRCWVTGNDDYESDVEGGSVWLVSPPLDFTDPSAFLDFAYWVSIDPFLDEALILEARGSKQGSWVELARYDGLSPGWRHAMLRSGELISAGLTPTDRTQLRFLISDPQGGSWVKAAIDAFRYGRTVCQTLGTSHCGPANRNSTGVPSLLGATGSPSVAAADVVLVAAHLPRGRLAMFLVGPEPTFLPYVGGGQGNLCLAGGVGRYRSQAASTRDSDWMPLRIDVLEVPTPGGFVAIQPGETWHFQCWYRDRNPHPTSNLTNAVGIEFE